MSADKVDELIAAVVEGQRAAKRAHSARIGAFPPSSEYPTTPRLGWHDIEARRARWALKYPEVDDNAIIRSYVLKVLEA